jgi:hypothetical protein
MNWSLFDFIIAGILLLSIGFLIVIAVRKIKNNMYKGVAICAILIGLFLVWAELAVGLFGTSFAGS